MNNKKGFSLIELAIGLAVITILVLAIAASAGIRNNARLQSAVNSIQTLRAASENYLSNGNLDYSSLSIDALQTAKLLPSGFDESVSNPWGGSYSIDPNTNPIHFDITLTNVTSLDNVALGKIFKNNATAINYSGTTWKVTF